MVKGVQCPHQSSKTGQNCNRPYTCGEGPGKRLLRPRLARVPQLVVQLPLAHKSSNSGKLGLKGWSTRLAMFGLDLLEGVLDIVQPFAQAFPRTLLWCGCYVVMCSQNANVEA